MTERIIREQMRRKILLLDGAMGTMLQNEQLTAADFGGAEYEGCNEYLSITRPDVIRSIHETYLEAGADIIETNTFGATSIVLSEFSLGGHAYELNKRSAELAKEACAKFSAKEQPRFAAGSMGPTTKTLSVTGGISFDELAEAYREQAAGLMDGGADLLLVETCQDMLNVKAAYTGIQQAFTERGRDLPIMISGTIEPMGTTLAGQSIEAFYLSCRHMNPLAVGLNCATGPEFMTDHIRSLSVLSVTGVSCYPNAGLPDEEGCYHETPESLSAKVVQFAEKGWVNIVGGCCGTTPAHIKALAEALKDVKPRILPEPSEKHAISGIEPLIYDETMRPLFVGERTNVIGSRKFKELIRTGKYEEAAEIARAQIKKGAHVIDICLADPDSDEREDMNRFIKEVAKKIKVPLVIDSTDEAVIETALKHSQGKAVINSINLEDGEERFGKIVPLIHQYGAAVVVGTIDEKGMAVDAGRKAEVAVRSAELLIHKYGLHPSDLIFDPLVFPAGTGDRQYTAAAGETVEGIRAIKDSVPGCLTILGISNVSFGLPPRGREVLNAVFLYHCTKAGLDYAIVNTEKLERFASIPDEEIKLAEDLLFRNSDETLAVFTDYYRQKPAKEPDRLVQLPIDERLAGYIVEGTKEGLAADLTTMLENGHEPLEVINGPLMAGMAEVGRLFNDNQLIVAEVLQSAEVMKAAVAQLEPHMTAEGRDARKGRILLATVKGDVHDIGKNLVDIILSNNGFEVMDLGIKVTSGQLIEAVRKYQPTAIGLSGLLVKSAQQMVLAAQDLKEAGISIPVLVGGAALSRKFTDLKISPSYEGPVIYAKDAMDGLAAANAIHNEKEKPAFLEALAQRQKKSEQNAAKAALLPKPARSLKVKEPIVPHQVKKPTHFKRRLLLDYPLSLVEPYINRQMLIGHHLGLKGKVAELLANGDERALGLHDVIESLLAFLKEDPLYSLNGVYRFFPAQSDGNQVLIYDPENPDTVLETFDFPRQQQEPGLCLADYLKSVQSGEMDYVGFFTVTAGTRIKQWAQEYKTNGEFLKSHALQALALETAEGFAERLHQQMRDEMGIADPIELTMSDRFAAKYTGQRFSFGYPACPNLEDQKKLFRLLRPEDAGIQLTDGCMMEPEASVSAIVFSHPGARYFNVSS